MRFYFKLEDYETTVSPIKLAEALTTCGSFNSKELGELGDYLCTYAAYHGVEEGETE